MSKKIFIGAIIVLAVVIAGVLAVRLVKNNQSEQRAPGVSQEPVFYGVKASESYSVTIPKDAILTPAQSESAAAANRPEQTEKLRVFLMKGAASGFDPNQIVINEGDLVQIKFTAVDGDYDFLLPYLGVYKSIKKGDTQSIDFGGGLTGTVYFMCRDFCPGGKVVKGSIIALPKK